ncbi:MAG: hypothetical protein ACJ76H_09830 [Bacteriovoracaceae bacterium]
MKILISLLFLFSCSQAPVAKKAPPKLSPYPRLETGIKRICQVSQEDDGFEYRYIFDCKHDYSPESRLPGGFGFTAKKGHPYRQGKAARTIDMISRNHALNETYLHVVDYAGGPDSQDWKSVIYLFPRTDLPDVKAIGNEVELTLPTGEKVNFDAHTGAIHGGALIEGPLDLNKNYQKRAVPNVNYIGDYVSVRLDHRFEEPEIAAETAHIQQKDKTCDLPRAKLFSKQGRLLTKSDDEMLEVLNRECPVKFSF